MPVLLWLSVGKGAIAMGLDAQEIAAGEAFVSLFLRLRAKAIDDSRIFTALEQTPKYNFIEPEYAAIALHNCVIPIPCGEYIERLDEQIALIASLQLEKKHRVLEVGTGSGFTAGVMARLAGRVTTVERYRTLCELARQRFQALRIDDIVLRQTDALKGLPGSGPFDRIIIWPAMENEPQHFMELLAGNGVLVAPVGPRGDVQTMVRYARIGSRFERTDMFRVRYQPFIEGVAAAL